MKERLRKEFKEFGLLLKTLPTLTTALFVVSVVAMNLLANKSIDLPVDWLALDCGIIVSWVAFLTMDVVTKHFGPKAANELTALGIAVNLGMCLIFFIASVISGTWGEAGGAENAGAINAALDKTFGGTWFVLVGSTLAFAVSAVVNNFINFGIGKALKKSPDGIAAYILRSYVSTAVGQFVDNLIFAFVVSKLFFGWSAVQCVTCAATGMIVELLCEAAFTALGYRITKRWKSDGVGAEYFEFRANKK